MKFGSEEIFSLIEDNIDKSDSSPLYETMYDVVKSDTLLMISKYRISKEEQEDIVQEVQIAVFTHLISFYESSKSSTVQQRNAWLRTIINNKCNDYFRFVCKKQSKDVPYDEMNEIVNNMPNTEDIVVFRDELFNTIRTVCDIPTTPDKILAFLLLKISCAEGGQRKNGSSKDISSKYYGKTLIYVFNETMKLLEIFFKCEIPIETVSVLKGKVNSADNKFELSARAITDSSNWIVSKVKQFGERMG